MIKLKNNTLTRDPLPAFLQGLQPESLRDLTWTDSALGVSDSSWLPEVDQSAPLQQYQRYGAETLTLSNGVAIVTRSVVVWNAAEIAADVKSKAAAALLKIDADTDAIYGAILGNRAEEYTSASDDAAAYKAAGYTGTTPPGVQSWATAKSWTATKAADDILATTTTWVTAQNAIRATRLAKKEQIRAATDAAGISGVLTTWAGFVVYMRGQLGL